MTTETERNTFFRIDQIAAILHVQYNRANMIVLPIVGLNETRGV